MLSSRVLLAVLCACVFNAVAIAQRPAKVTLRGPSPATVALGAESQALITVSFAPSTPRIETLPKVDGLRLTLSAPSTQMRSFNGRITSSDHTYRLTITPTREGTYEVPPIEVILGAGDTRRTPSFKVHVVRDLEGAKFTYLDVTASRRRVYIHEPLEITLVAGAEQGLRLVREAVRGQRYYLVKFEADWLDKAGFGELVDAGDRRGGQPNQIPLVVNDHLEFAALDEGVMREGKRYNQFTIRRELRPTEVGTFTLDAPILRTSVEQGSVRRTVFGVQREQKPLFAYSKSLPVEVVPLPTEGRPANYSGAVGRFSISSSVDRPELRVGDAIGVSLMLRGSGNFDYMRVPELDSLPGFHRLGIRRESTKEGQRVVYDLRVLDADVTEVPSIDWNWFDTTPGIERYEEQSTAAIPLNVLASDGGGGLEVLPGDAKPDVVLGVDDIYDLPAALNDGSALAAPAEPASWLRYAAVFGPWVFAMGFAFTTRRRRRLAGDVQGKRERTAAKHFQSAVRGGTEPVQALAEFIGARLGLPAAAAVDGDLASRLVARGAPQDVAEAARDAMQRGAAGRYGGGEGLSADAASEVVKRLGSVNGLRLTDERGVVACSALLSLILCLVTGASVHGWIASEHVPLHVDRSVTVQDPERKAQESQVAGQTEQLLVASRAELTEAAERLYRKGDAAGAAAAFERALEVGIERAPDVRETAAWDVGLDGLREGTATPRPRSIDPGYDARLDQALGNARYRLGEERRRSGERRASQAAFAEAKLAWARAALVMPRDSELQANIALVDKQLELEATSDGLLASWTSFRDRTTTTERLILAALLHALAALLLLGGLAFGGLARPGVRFAGVVVALVAIAVTIDFMWLDPQRPAQGVVLIDAKAFAEPREDLEPVLTLRPGVTVEVLGRGAGWAHIVAADRRGYVPEHAVGTIE